MDIAHPTEVVVAVEHIMYAIAAAVDDCNHDVEFLSMDVCSTDGVVWHVRWKSDGATIVLYPVGAKGVR